MGVAIHQTDLFMARYGTFSHVPRCVGKRNEVTKLKSALLKSEMSDKGFNSKPTMT